MMQMLENKMGDYDLLGDSVTNAGNKERVCSTQTQMLLDAKWGYLHKCVQS